MDLYGVTAEDVAAILARVNREQSGGTGKLHTDLQAMYKAGKAGHDIHAASERVYKDCAAIGITS